MDMTNMDIGKIVLPRYKIGRQQRRKKLEDGIVKMEA